MKDDGREGGYILLARKLQSSPMWIGMSDAQRVTTLELLFHARFEKEPRKTHAGTIQRGQSILSIQRIMDISPTQKSKRIVEQTLAKLISSGTITVDDRGRSGRLITFVNYGQYQDPGWYTGEGEGVGKGEGQGVDPKKVKKGRKKQPEDPQLTTLVDALKATYREVKGEDMDWRGASYGDLAGIRAILSDDGEVQRRWRLFLVHKYWPKKNMHSFREAFQIPAISAGKPSSLTLLPGIPEFG
jgi:hypothetical protein